MKMKPEHYEYLKSAMLKKLTTTSEEDIKGYWVAVRSDHRVKDLGKRSRWDLMYAANLTTFVCDTLYKYLDDTHIDTALKSISKEIGWEAPK